MSSLKKNIVSLFSTGFILFFFILMPGCNETFEPLRENDLFFFSVYGYLDVSADTQWVRITEVRDSLNPIEHAIESDITLEHMEENEVVTLKDSLFHYFHGGLAYNFWTSSMDLKAGDTYRLTASRPDGNSSQAIINMPDDFPTPYFVIGNFLAIEGVDHVADVRTVYHLEADLTGEQYLVTIPQPNYYRFHEDEFRAEINSATDLQYIQEFHRFTTILDRQIFVAAAGPDWPDFRSLNPRAIPLPKAYSNIENGVGYLAGVVSKTIPLETCRNEEGINIACPEEPRPW